MRHLIPTLLLSLLFTATAAGQQYPKSGFPLEDQNLYFTIKGGIQKGSTGPQITNIIPSIISDDFDPTTYETTELQEVGLVIGPSLYYRFNMWLSMELDLLFANNKGGYQYNDEKSLNNNALYYDLTLNYWYLNIVAGPKIYPFGFGDRTTGEWPHGFYLRPGIYGSFNVFNHGQKKLTYLHTPESLYGPSEYIEEELRTLVIGQNNWGVMGAVGFEWTPNELFGLILEAGYYHGFNDVITIKPQPYGFRSKIENHIRPFQLTVGLAIALSENP